MTVKKEASGHRSVQAEVEVPGTPEAVWRAIATGPGISAWFVPTDLEERAGGTTVSHFAEDNSMDSVAKITTWEPPHRFVAETQEGGPGPVATEWSVETRSGDTCVVRVVHRWFASTDDWDGQFEGHAHGWRAFFRLLRAYLAHFPGQRAASFQLMGITSGPKAAAWETLTRPLGLAGATAGTRVRAPEGVPALGGVVESSGPSEWPDLLLQLDTPAPGLAHLFPLEMGGQVFVTVRCFLFGEQAPAAKAHAEASWRAWMARLFPPAAPQPVR
ncbi:SRPBCC domain-containing protein [Archangium violaceum]|uniref:SRPBCC family protein n=1 Tax=Archangium violaceum TaxID=83451 RepID=UPI002B2F969F|nr:SRPBCC domain-containing protein [Archangium gephyra]